MRKYLVFCTWCIASIAIAWAADSPQAKLIEPNQDHGTVFVGTVIKGKFFVENTGSVPFSITDAKPTCHCTTAVVSRDEVMPGARGEISYEITTAGVGKSVKNIRIVTDPPLPEQLIFTSSVTFAPFIEADAKDLLVDVAQGERVNVRIPLHIAQGIEGIKLLGASTRSRDMQVSLEGPSNGADHTLVLQSINTLPAGKRPVVAELEFEKDEKGMQNLTVTVNVVPAILITPAPIMVKFEPGKDDATIPVTLKNMKGNLFTIKSVVAKSCVIREVALPKEPATEHSLLLTFARPADRQSMRGFLSFEFDGDFGKQTIYAVFQRELGTAAAAPVVEQGKP